MTDDNNKTQNYLHIFKNDPENLYNFADRL